MPSLIGGSLYKHGGTFRVDSTGESSNVTLHLIHNGESLTDTGFLAQNVTASVARQDRTVFEINSIYYYQIQGRPSGNGSIQHFVGPNTKNGWEDIQRWADCDPSYLKVEVKKPSCGSDEQNSGPIYFNGGFLNSVQIQAAAGDVIVTSNLGFSFVDLADEPTY